MLNNSDHPNHTTLTYRLHAYLAWRNANPIRLWCTNPLTE